MGNRYSDAPYIGLLIPDERIKTANLRANDGATGNSDYTQAGPRPGVPEFDQAEVALSSSTAGDYSPSLSLETLGEQDAGTDYHVKVIKGGMPGADATVVRRDDLTGSVWRGWNTPNVVTHFNVDSLLDRDTSAGVNYAAVTSADDQALYLYWKATQLKARKYDPETRTAAAAVVVVDASAAINADAGTYEPPSTAADNLVDAIVLPSGRVVAYYLTRELDNQTNVQLAAAYSDDHGATWRTAQYLGLDAVIDLGSSNVYKLRAGYSSGSVLLVIDKEWFDPGSRRGLLQYASDDTGLNFELIKDDEVGAATDIARHPDVMIDRVTGSFLLAIAQPVTSRILVYRLSSPYVAYENGELAHEFTSVTIDHLVAWPSDSGSLYLTFDSTDGVELYESRDQGTTWVEVEKVWNWNSAEEVFVWEVTEAGGRACWILNHTASSGTLPIGASTFVIHESGGWNTISQPRILGQDPTVNRGFGSTTGPEAGTWIATDAPEYFGFTKTGAAVIPRALAPLGLNITGATHYSVNPTAGERDGLICFWTMKIASAGTVGALETGVKVVLGTFEIEVRYSATQIRLWDVHGGVAVGTVTPGSLGTAHAYKLALRLNAAGVAACSVTLYRRATTGDAWETLITTSSLTVGGSATNLIDWGNFATHDTTWSHFHWVADAGNGEQGTYFDDLSQDVLDQDPFVLYGAPLPVPPFSLYADQRLRLRGTSGPATRGDTWKIRPRFDHPVEALDYTNSATPDRRWRSVGTGEALVAWDLTLDSTLGGSSIGLYLGGINFPRADLQGWNGAAWVTLASLYADQGLTGLPCTVTGNTVTVNAGLSIDARYIEYGEFVGGYARFNGGDIRRIAWNSEGTYTDNVTKRPVFRFEGAAPAGATATMELWHPSALVILHESVTLYDRYALRIPSQSTAEGYFEVGVCLVGAMAMFGRKYARGRVIETAPNYSLSQDQAGARQGRKLGPARRAVSFGWSETDLSAISGSSPDPDYISPRPAATSATADRYGAPLLVEGLIRDLGGAARPVVYVPNIPETSPGNLETRLSSRAGFIYSRITGSVSRQARIGTENQDEVVTLTGVRLEEEV